MADDPRQKLVPAVQNAAAVLRHLSAQGTPRGATQIARDCALNVSSAFNILRTLTAEGLVSFDAGTKTYRLGLGLLDMAQPLLATGPADLIRPLMAEIAHEHRVMIALWHITGTGRIVLVDRVTAERIVQAAIARDSRLPVFAGAVGRCYAAALDLSEDEARAGYETVHWQSDPGFDAYWAGVRAARSRGYAADHGALFRGLEIVASVARDRTGIPRIGMSSITIAHQHTEDELARVGRALARAAASIERGLYGYTPTSRTEETRP